MSAVITRFAYPVDDECQHQAPAVTVQTGTEDPAYPAANLVDANPAKPAKLTTTSGAWVLDFGSAVTIRAAALIYHQLDHGLDVTLEANASSSWGAPSFSASFTIPGKPEDNWTISPWIEFDAAQTYRYWRLVVGDGSPANLAAVGVGRLMLLSHLRDAWAAEPNDVRWGVEEDEDHGLIELPTELGVETIYALGGKRRRFSGELALGDTTAAEFIALVRSAGGRVEPWLLIPDEAVNDAWLVRFEESRWARTYEIINHNIFPFRVQELSRGLPWP